MKTKFTKLNGNRKFRCALCNDIKTYGASFNFTYGHKMGTCKHCYILIKKSKYKTIKGYLNNNPVMKKLSDHNFHLIKW